MQSTDISRQRVAVYGDEVRGPHAVPDHAPDTHVIREIHRDVRAGIEPHARCGLRPLAITLKRCRIERVRIGLRHRRHQFLLDLKQRRSSKERHTDAATRRHDHHRMNVHLRLRAIGGTGSGDGSMPIKVQGMRASRRRRR